MNFNGGGDQPTRIVLRLDRHDGKSLTVELEQDEARLTADALEHNLDRAALAGLDPWRVKFRQRLATVANDFGGLWSRPARPDVPADQPDARHGDLVLQTYVVNPEGAYELARLTLRDELAAEAWSVFSEGCPNPEGMMEAVGYELDAALDDFLLGTAVDEWLDRMAVALDFDLDGAIRQRRIANFGARLDRTTPDMKALAAVGALRQVALLVGCSFPSALALGGVQKDDLEELDNP